MLLDYFEIIFSQKEIMIFDSDHMNKLINFDNFFEKE